MSTAVNIRICGIASEVTPGVKPGLAKRVVWLRVYDPEAHEGRGAIVFTEDRGKAAVFPSAAQAFEAWRSVPKARPIREDGRPNRPLTAYHVEFIEVGKEPIA